MLHTQKRPQYLSWSQVIAPSERTQMFYLHLAWLGSPRYIYICFLPATFVAKELECLDCQFWYFRTRHCWNAWTHNNDTRGSNAAPLTGLPEHFLTRSRKTYKQQWAATDPNKPTPSPTPRNQRSQRVSQVESVVVIGIFGHRCLVLTTIRGRNQQRLSKQDRRRTNIYRKNRDRCFLMISAFSVKSRKSSWVSKWPYNL